MRLELGISPISVILVKQLLLYWIKVMSKDNTVYVKLAYLRLSSLASQKGNSTYNWTLIVQSIIMVLVLVIYGTYRTQY